MLAPVRSQPVPFRAPLPQLEPAAPRRPLAPVDVFAAPRTETAARATRPADGLKAYEELSAGQKSLLGPDGAKEWPTLTTKQRGVFLTITDRLAKNGINLEGLRLQGGAAGINGNNTRFELLFDKPSADNLRAQVDAAKARGLFNEDPPFEPFHKAYAESGVRENRAKFPLQIGFGEGGAFVDLDRYNPRTSKLNWIKHWGEILTPGNIDPVKVSSELGTDIFSRL